MPSLYSKLYSYTERRSISPLENFLTEAFSDVVNRTPAAGRVTLIQILLEKSAATLLGTIARNGEDLICRTQVSIGIDNAVKRPDIIVYHDEKPIVIVEVKIGARVQDHVINNLEADEYITRTQLETYASWIGAQERPAGWPGAVVFLTAHTRAPDRFLTAEGGAVRSEIKWRNVAQFLMRLAGSSDKNNAHSALSKDLANFIRECGLMNEYISSRDISAASLFMSSYDNMKRTFRILVEDISRNYPKLKGGNFHVEFWPEFYAYSGYFYLNKNLMAPRTKPYLAIGIAFEVSGECMEDLEVLPKDEPFFFIAFEDEWGERKGRNLLDQSPDGWVEIEEGRKLVTARSVSSFTAESSMRVQQINEWSCLMVGRLTDCLPGFKEAPIDKSGGDEE